MIWLTRDLDLLIVILHAAILSLEALLVGGVLFFSFPARTVTLDQAAIRACGCLMQWSAAGLVVVEAGTMAITGASMLAGSTLTVHDLLSASYLRAESLTILLAASLGILARLRPALAGVRSLAALLAVSLVVSVIFLSHALSQMEHRALLAALTALHHLGTAAWLGAMPFLLLSLARTENVEQTDELVRRYSAMALVGVPALIGAGIGMAWFYVGPGSRLLPGLYGTSYGIMVLAKVFLLVLMLALGAGNWSLLRTSAALPSPLLLRIRRFSEAEIGIGFTVLLAAASLTSQSPAADMQPRDMVSAQTFRQQMLPVWPRMSSPAVADLAPPSSMKQGVIDHQFGAGNRNDAIDDAWSEYNHHWAGFMVLVAGFLALLSRSQRMRWARYWPVAFAGLAFFIVLRADPEAWPLGPRPFWASFSYPDVLEHRLEAFLIIGFATFEAAVQAGRLKKRWSYVFPLVCALGAALLLTHSHGFGDISSEVLAEASHTMIAVLGATVAWTRWLELRVAPSRQQRIVGTVWPVALMLAGLVLLNYRES